MTRVKAGRSVFYDDYLSKWVEIDIGDGSSALAYGVSSSLTGTSSDPGSIAADLWYNGKPASEGRVHPEFAPDGGQTEYVTFSRVTGEFSYDVPTSPATGDAPLGASPVRT